VPKDYEKECMCLLLLESTYYSQNNKDEVTSPESFSKVTALIKVQETQVDEPQLQYIQPKNGKDALASPTFKNS